MVEGWSPCLVERLGFFGQHGTHSADQESGKESSGRNFLRDDDRYMLYRYARYTRQLDRALMAQAA